MKNRSLAVFGKICLGLTALLFAPALLRAASTSPAGTTTAAPFTQATIDDLAGDVTVIPKSAPDTSIQAKLNDIFKAPDTLKTGARSRVELKAADGTIARVGSRTVFSLEENTRTIHLDEGSILFNCPKGMQGGGTIVTKSATATVLGTTIIVSATSNGGFKVMVLEGHASITLPGGNVVTLGPGQMTFVLPGNAGGSGGGNTGGKAGPVLNFDLSRLAASSGLLNDFTVTLPSDSLILDATRGQQILIKNGELIQTNQAVVGAITSTQVVLVDQSEVQAAIDASRNSLPNTNERLAQALASSLTLGSNLTIPDLNIFLDVTNVSNSLANIPSNLAGKSTFGIQGLVAGDISASGQVDLSSLEGLTNIVLVAGNQNTFTFTDDTQIIAPESAEHVTLYSAGSFDIAPNIDITFGYNQETLVPGVPTPDAERSDGLVFDLVSVGAMNLNSNYLTNQNGSIYLSTYTGAISLENSTLDASYYNRDEIDVRARTNDVSIADSEILSGRFGYTYLLAGGNLSITDSSLVSGSDGSPSTRGYQINGSAVGSLTFNGSYANASTVSLIGGSSATISNSSFYSSEPEITVGAKTVVISNQSFAGSSDLTFYSATGNVDFLTGNQTPVAGDINILSGVTYGESNITTDDFSTGITADNAGVQAALATNLTLPTGSVPENLQFEEVLFTPANLAAYTSDGVHTPLFFDEGLIVGNLNIQGNASADGVYNVVAGNIKFNGTATLGDDDDLYVTVLGNVTIPAGSNITFASDSDGDMSFYLDSYSPLVLSNVNLSAPNGTLEFDSESNAINALSFNTVGLQAASDIYLDAYGDGSIIITNSTFTAGSGLDFYSENDGDISISGSNLTAQDGYLELYAGGESSSTDASLTINSSTLSAPDDGMDLEGYAVRVNQSDINSEGEMYFDATGLIDIESSNLTSTDSEIYMDSYGPVTIANSMLSTDGDVEIYSYDGAEGITFTNSTINSSYVDVEVEDAPGPLTVTASNITSNSDTVYLESYNDSFGDSTSPNNITIQSSNITASDDEVYLYADNAVTITNSNLTGIDDEVYVEANSINVTNSTLQGGGSDGTSGTVEFKALTVANVTNGKIIGAFSVGPDTDDVANSTLTINLNNVDVSLAPSISLAARTINLSNINFAANSTVSLSSANGILAPNPNTNASPVVGDVNFITNVKYNGQPAQNFVPIAVGGSSTNPSAPIQIHPLLSP